jgi:hypothetical protein
MALVAKLPVVNPGAQPPYLPYWRRFWQRWNKQTSLVVFIIGVGVLWLGISLLLILEIP